MARATAPAPLLRADGPVPPLLKWPGGKRQELVSLVAEWPVRATRYLEPFVGGGAMLFATSPAVPAEVNDASADLVGLYRSVQSQDAELFRWLRSLAEWWLALGDLDVVVEALVDLHDLADDPAEPAARILAAHGPRLASTVPVLQAGLDDLFLAQLAVGVPRKLRRMRRVQADAGQRLPDEDLRANVEGAIRAAAYTTIREVHNAARRSGSTGADRVATFAVLRDLAYAAMFRFNASGDFNVPYGGISYNRRDLHDRIDAWRDDGLGARLANATVHLGDFERFFEVAGPTAEDFVFLDPPYLSEFRDYDGNGFGPQDHQRLASVLRDLPCPFQLVIKATPRVREWYSHPDWTVIEADKVYAWTIKGRNDRRATHLVIQNA